MRASVLRQLTCGVVLCAALSATAPAATETPAAIGQATFVIGDVQARDTTGTARPLGRGGDLYNGDVIVTGANAVAQLRFADDSRMVVRRSSEVAIDDFQFGAGKESMVVRLAFGALRSITGMIGRNNKRNVSFRTEVATIGIRGTDFEAVHVPVGRTDLFGAGEKLDPGTYNKVYAGGTQLVSKLGTIDLNINEAGFIGLQQGLAKSPIKIDQLPPVLLKVIESTPQLGKLPARGAEPGPGAPLPGAESPPGVVDKGDGARTLPPPPAEGTPTVKTITTLPVLNTLETKTLDGTRILSTEPVKTLIAPTTTLKTEGATGDTTLKLDPSISTTTILSPTTATKTLSPTTSTLIAPTTTISPTTSTLIAPTTTLSPTTSTLIAPTTTLSPTTSTLIAPTTTTLSPTTSTIKTLSPTTTTILQSPTLSAPLLQK